MKLFDFLKRKKEEPLSPAPFTEVEQPQQEKSFWEDEFISVEQPGVAQQEEQESTTPEVSQETPEPQPKTEEKKEQNAAMTLYACRKNMTVIPSILEAAFAEHTKKVDFVSKDVFVITLKDDTFVQIHIVAGKQENITQAYGMANYFSKAPIRNKVLKENILQQMKMFNCIIGIQFQITKDKARTSNIIHSVYHASKELLAFVLVPTMELYHYDGRLLINLEGKTEFDTFSPIATADFLEKTTQPTEADKARKAKSLAVLKEKQISYIEELRSAAFEADTVLRDKTAIVERLIATYATCVQAEIYASGKYDNPEEKMKEQLALLEEKYEVSNCFSPEEREYINNPPIQEHRIFNSYGWRYECCAVFLWALSLLELKEPNQICEALELGNIIWNHDKKSLLDAAKLRSKEEILDLQDLTLRYDWACVDARINGTTIDSLDFGVVFERHYALNWLLTVDGIDDWDAIITNT